MSEQHWALTGKLSHAIYSPKGGIEGVLLDVGGVPAQFVVPPHLEGQAASWAAGQSLELVGTLRKPSDKGEAEHEVYELVEVVGGKDGTAASAEGVSGRVARFNYAKHGEPNGVVLDTGDFIHTKPAGLKKLGWKVGSQVSVKGHAKPMKFGSGRVLEYAD